MKITHYFSIYDRKINLVFRLYSNDHYMTVLLRLFPKFEFWYDKRKNIITGEWKWLKKYSKISVDKRIKELKKQFPKRGEG